MFILDPRDFLQYMNEKKIEETIATFLFCLLLKESNNNNKEK